MERNVSCRTAVVFQTHFFDRGLARQFERLRQQCPPDYDCFVLIHLPAGTPKPRPLLRFPHHLVTTPELRAMPYPRKTAEEDWTGRRWELWGGGHCDLIPLHFFNAHPGYRQYWILEYDVRFTGRWQDLFAHFEASAADYLSTSIRRFRDQPVWWNWPSVQGPLPPGAVTPHLTASFPVLYRVSRRAFSTMDRAYRLGWGGHIEAAWATILSVHGMALEDIGGAGEFVASGNRERFYTSARPNERCDLLAPGTVTAKPPLFRPGSSRNRLYHPVKPFRFWPEVKHALWEARVWQGAKRRSAMAWLRSAMGARTSGRC